MQHNVEEKAPGPVRLRARIAEAARRVRQQEESEIDLSAEGRRRERDERAEIARRRRDEALDAEIRKAIAAHPSTPRAVGKAARIATAEVYGVTVEDIVGHRRTRRISLARRVAVWITVHGTGRSLPAVGDEFGGKDHTSIMYAVRKVDEALAEPHDPTGVRAAIERILEIAGLPQEAEYRVRRAMERTR